MLQTNIQNATQWDAISNFSAFELSGDSVTFSFSIEARIWKSIPHPSTQRLSFNPSRTEVIKYYCLGLPKSFSAPNERALSVRSQSLNTPPPREPGRRPTEPEDNLSDQYPSAHKIHNFPFPLTLTHCPWNTLGCLLGVIFLYIISSSWD